MFDPLANLTLCKDVVFRSVFARKSMLPSLRALLNAIFSHLELPLVESLTLTSEFSLPEARQKKTSIMDVVATDSTGRGIDIEMQVEDEHNAERRTEFYVSRGFSGSLGEGERYKELHPYYVLMFTCFPIPNAPNFWIDCRQLTSIYDPKIRSESMTVIYVRLPRLNEVLPDGSFSSDLKVWSDLLTTNLHNESRLEELGENGKEFKNVVRFLKGYMGSEELRMWLTEEQLWEMEQRSKMEDAIENARESCRKEMEQKVFSAEQENKKNLSKSIELFLSSRFPQEYPSFAGNLSSRFSTKSSAELGLLVRDSVSCSSLSDFASRL